MTTSKEGDSLSLFTSNSSRGVLSELLPQFERASGTRVSVSYDPALVMLKRIEAGESADLAILGQASTLNRIERCLSLRAEALGTRH